MWEPSAVFTPLLKYAKIELENVCGCCLVGCCWSIPWVAKGVRAAAALLPTQLGSNHEKFRYIPAALQQGQELFLENNVFIWMTKILYGLSGDCTKSCTHLTPTWWPGIVFTTSDKVGYPEGRKIHRILLSGGIIKLYKTKQALSVKLGTRVGNRPVEGDVTERGETFSELAR